MLSGRHKNASTAAIQATSMVADVCLQFGTAIAQRHVDLAAIIVCSQQSVLVKAMQPCSDYSFYLSPIYQSIFQDHDTALHAALNSQGAQLLLSSKADARTADMLTGHAILPLALRWLLAS